MSEEVFKAVVRAKYRITIPPVVRKLLSIRVGDVVEVRIRRVGRFEEKKEG